MFPPPVYPRPRPSRRQRPTTTDVPPIRQPLLFQPVETRTPFSFSRLVDESRAVWFPEIDDEVEVRIGGAGSLACVWYHRMGQGRHVIVFHPILNRPDTPIEVVRFIAKHELAHILHPEEGHSPAVWEHELRVGPERFAVWAWVHQNLDGPVRGTRWGTRVLRSWRSRVRPAFAPYTPHLPFDDVPWRVLCPEGGAQLRLPPDWSAGPAPLEPGAFGAGRQGLTKTRLSRP